MWTVSTCLVGRCDNQSCIELSQGTEDTVCIPSSQTLLLLMLLIPWCNLICSELVHSILLFKVSLIRVHLHFFLRKCSYKVPNPVCVRPLLKNSKRDRVEKCDLCFSILPSNLSVLYTGKYDGVGMGDRVKERACEWVESELCIVKNKIKTHRSENIYF